MDDPPIVYGPLGPNPERIVKPGVEEVTKDFDLLGYYNVNVKDLQGIKCGGLDKKSAGHSTKRIPV